jgi:acyl transferase domain-containing protein/thioesterase domain-containing protein/aryl carrier-like protein
MTLRQPSGGASTLERALHALEKLEAKLAAAERASTEPIAIIGTGCRFPGGARGPEGLWHVLHSGINGVIEVPAERWNYSGGLHPSARLAGLLENVDQFDGAFFGLGREDVVDMDPQHRLLLEVAWEAIENGGVTPDRLTANKTGVFVAIASQEYFQMLSASATEPRPYIILGNASSFAPGRIAYLLGLRGPCLSVDTACSSALVALHLACQSLRRGECDMALVGGVNLLLSPETSNLLASLQILSPDGACRTFDAQANGTVRAEGAGFVLLERQSDAIKLGDRILALVRGSAVSQNGRATSITAPSVQAQAAVIRAALQDARVAPEQVGYVEVHSNGSPMGDSVELEALREALGQPRKDRSQCVLGSVKTSIGHAEAASGMASLIKAVLVLNHDIIPRNLHFKSLHPNASIDDTPFVIPTNEVVWKRTATPRFAGVSATGLSGSNAHVVLQEPPPESRQWDKHERPVHLFVLSARTPLALKDHAAQMLRYVKAHPELSIGDQSLTLGAGRVHFEHRFAAVVASNAELAGQLTDFIDDAPTRYLTGRVQSLSARRRIGFVFTGCGKDVRGTLGSIEGSPPAFRDALQQADNAVLAMMGQSVAHLLEGDSVGQGSADPVALELALFILQYALVEQWRAWGIEGALVVGVGTGELVAAWAAGALEFADALTLVAARARLVMANTARGVTDFARTLSAIKFVSPRRTFISSLGEGYSSASLQGVAYWERRMAVREDWGPIVARLTSPGYDTFIECGPRPELVANSSVVWSGLKVVASLQPSADVFRSLYDTLGQLYVRGFGLHWQRLNELHPYQRIALPTYPFQRQRYWFGMATSNPGIPASASDGYTLPGRPLEPRADRPEVRTWELILDETNCRMVGTHLISDIVVLSSGGIVEVAGAVARDVFVKKTWELSLTLGDPPSIENGAVAAVQVIATPRNDLKIAVEIFFRARVGVPWKRFANGTAEVSKPVDDIDDIAPPSIRVGRRQSLPLAMWGHRLETLGVRTEVFHVEQIWRRDGETLAKVYLKGLQSSRSVVRAAVGIASITHPAIHGRWWMIESIEGLTMNDKASEGGAWLRLNWNANDGFSARIGVELVDEDGWVVAAARHIELRAQDQLAVLRAMGRDPFEKAFVDYIWKEVPQAAATGVPRRWVILTDEGGIGSALATHLKMAGHTVFTLPVAVLERHSEKLDMILLSGTEPFAGVVYLGALDAPLNESITPPFVGDVLFDSVAVALRIVQCLAGLIYVPRLWFVTQGAQSLNNATSSLAQAGLWGIGRVLSTEQPDMWGGIIDIDPTFDENQIAQLAQVLTASGPENQVILRGGKSYVARLAYLSAPEEQSFEVRPDRTYCLTGTRSPLGMEAARWLLERGAKNLIFADWNIGALALGVDATDGAYDEFRVMLQARGANVVLIDGNGSDPDAIRKQLVHANPPLAGILHTACAIDQRMARLASRGGLVALRQNLQPHTALLWALHEATAEIPLEFFVMFSSVPAAFGWEGFGAGAVVSAYLDAMARIRRSMGAACTSMHIAFPHESRPGGTELDQELLAAGFQGMATTNSLNAISRFILNPISVATFAWVDWNFLECSGRADPMKLLLEGLAEGRSARVGPVMMQRRVVGADPEQARRIVESMVRSEVLHVFGANDSEILNDQEFASLGMDSIMSVQVLTRIGRACGVNLPVSILLERPTIQLLTRRVLQTIRPDMRIADGEITSGPLSRLGLLVEFNREGTARPFFFAPPLTGSGLIYQSIVQHLPKDRPFCTFNAPGIDSDAPPCERVDVLAGRFVEALRKKQPRGPYHLGGYSFGVLVAFEMAQILVRAGEKVDTLLLIDLPLLTDGGTKLSPLGNLARIFEYSVEEDTFDTLDGDEQAVRMAASARSALMLPPEIGESSQQLRVYGAHLRAIQAYVPKPYSGRVTVVRAQDTVENAQRAGIASADSTFGWSSLSPHPVLVHDLPGDHFTILLVPELAHIIQSTLEQAESGEPGR